MANLNKIQVGSTTYNIEDASGLYVKKAGDTMTGELYGVGYYVRDCQPTPTQNKSFGWYQWGDQVQFTYRKADKSYDGQSFAIYVTDGHSQWDKYAKFNADIYGNATNSLGTSTYPFHTLNLGGATSENMSATSGNPKITFTESSVGAQPVHIMYTDYDGYRNPAGLKVLGNSAGSSSPAWFEVEGDVYANRNLIINNHCTQQYNATTQALDFIFS